MVKQQIHVLVLANVHLILITLFAINSLYVYKMDLRKYTHPLALQYKLLQGQSEKYNPSAIIREIYALPFHIHCDNIKKNNIDGTNAISNRDIAFYPQ